MPTPRQYLSLRFDPFDALGLSPGIYTEDEIKDAWKRVLLIVHPDKNAKPKGRFPDVRHVQEAKDFLLSFISLGSIKVIAEEFNSYPRTFFGVKFLDPWVHDAHLQFRQCDICSSAHPRRQIESHLYKEHKREYCQDCENHFEPEERKGHTCEPERKHCQYCNEHVTSAEFANHLLNVHQLILCETCNAHVDTQYARQHRYFHRCPFCTIRLPRCSLQKHAAEAHNIEPCQDCPVARSMESHKKLVGHLYNKHKTQACIFCGLVVELRFLQKHLETKHELLTCGGCDVSKTIFAEHVSKAHGGAINCRLCNTVVTGEMRLPHLREMHGFLDCLVCGRLGHSWEHILNGHKWAYCQACECERHEPVSVHLVTEHAWKICRDCDDVFATDEELLSHEKAHSFINCSDCRGSKRVLIENYRQHLRDAHQKFDCFLCESEEAPEPMTISDLRRHIEENHPPTHPCPDCNLSQAVDNLPFHLKERHHWMMCVPCNGSFKSNHELNAHVASEHAQCEHCEECPPRNLMSEHLINNHNFTLQPPCSNGHQQRQSAVQTPDDLDDLDGSDDLAAIKIKLKGLKDADSGVCPFIKCKKSEYVSLAQHLRAVHKVFLTSLKPFRGERMSCKGRPGIVHSVNYSWTCAHCREWRGQTLGKRKRGASSAVVQPAPD